MKPIDMFKRMQRLQGGIEKLPDNEEDLPPEVLRWLQEEYNRKQLPPQLDLERELRQNEKLRRKYEQSSEKYLLVQGGTEEVYDRDELFFRPGHTPSSREASRLYDPGEGVPPEEDLGDDADLLAMATIGDWQPDSYKSIGVHINGKEIEIPQWGGQTPHEAEEMARMKLEWGLDPFATEEELEAVQNAAHMGPDDATMDPESPNYTGNPGYAGGEEDVAGFTEKEIREMPPWLRDIFLTTPKYPRATRPGEDVDPKSVPIIQWEGEGMRHYDPRFGAEDERLMAKEGETDVEPLKLAGGSSGLPRGFTSFWPGGGHWEGPNRVAAGSNILGGHPWQYYDIGNPQAPWIGLEGPRGSLGEWRKIPGESRMGRVIDVKQKGYGGYGILKKGRYDSRGNYISGSGGGGGGGTIPGGPFQGWTPEAMRQWHSGTPPSGMNYPEFTGNTAGPGGQQLAYETTSYNIPGYGWVPRATLANAQASNNLLDYLNPFGGTSKGGSGTGDPTQRGVGMAVGTASNLIIPGLGFVTGPIARWITSKFQGQNPTPKQVQQAVQEAQKQGELPPMPTGSVSLPTQPSQGVGFDPWGNPDTGNRWSNDFGRGTAGPATGFGGTKFGQFGTGFGTGTVGNFNTAIGFGGSYGGGSNAGDTSRFMSGAGYNRPYSADQWANMRGSKKYAAPTLSTAEGGITPQMGYDQYLQMFHPIGSVGSSTGYGGAAYSGGGPQGIGGGKTSFKPNLNQKVFAMGTSNVNPGLKLFHTTQLKRKK